MTPPSTLLIFRTVILVAVAPACATVPAGHAGVLFRSDGKSQSVGEGDLWIPPAGSLAIYDTRVQRRTKDFAALTADGASIRARASLFAFRALPMELVALHREVGPHYDRVLVEPVVESAVREAFGAYQSDQLDTWGIRRIQEQATQLAQEQLVGHHVALESIELRGVFVVSDLAYAVTLGTSAKEQEALRASSILAVARERAEAERQKARGIADAHRLIAETLSGSVLEDRWNDGWTLIRASPTSTFVLMSSMSPVARIEVDP